MTLGHRNEEESENRESNGRVLVVGIGASAGGLRPLQELLSSLELRTGCAFVVVQHLSPDFESLMNEVLARSTKIPIKMITDGLEVLPDTIYLNTPRFDVRISDGRFVLSLFDDGALKLPINSLFDSLASEYGESAVAVVLSGTGSDGALGIKSVHEQLGLTIVQSVDSAQFDGMPLNAIQTGKVHYVLPPGGIAELICSHAVRPTGVGQDASVESLEVLNEVQLIFSLLESKYSIDFAHYKPTTVARRIDRRLQMSRFKGLQEYALEIQKNEDELATLYHDLLIGVTKFFRDQQAFDALKRELRPLVQSATREEPLRIWSAGCASGEEAYSIAILVYEMFSDQSVEPHFKVFATDVHDRALEVATRGIYPEESLGQLSASRKHFFALQDDGRFKVVPRIRNHLVFAKHNVVTDPPFTKMNAVSCRNMLIYLQDEAQSTAIAGFRYALNPGGVMFLGPSETVGKMARGFDVIDKKWRLFRKNEYVRSPAEKRRSTSASIVGKSQSRTLEMVKAQTRTQQLPEMLGRFLADFVDPTILLDREKTVIHAFGDARLFVEERFADANGRLMDLFSGATQAAVFALVAQAFDDVGREFTAHEVDVTLVEGKLVDRIVAKAIVLADTPSPIVVLRFLSSSTSLAKSNEASPAQGASAPIAKVQEELQATRETLGASIRELETSNETLQSTNEEMVASNEELQATNEELQSVNEELHTVNYEHQRKVKELEEVTDDFNNLLNVTEVGLILLDDQMRIRKFTRAARKYFNLLHHDIGRHLTNFAPKIELDGLFDWIREVVDTGQAFATHADDQEGNLISVKVSPYQTNNEISGVVMHLIDLTATRSREREIAGSLTINPGDGICHWNRNTRQMWWSPYFFRLLGIKEDAVTPSKDLLRSLIHPTDRPWFDSVGSMSKNREAPCPIQIKRSNGAYLSFEFRCVANNDFAGRPEGLTGILRSYEESGQAGDEFTSNGSSSQMDATDEKYNEQHND